MECDICLIEWDTVAHIPRILSCGHTICEACLINMLNKCKSKKDDMFCPACMKVQKDIVSENDIKNLIKNINLLRITEKIENRRTALGQSFVTSRDNLNISMFSKSNMNLSNLYSDKNFIFGVNELVCKQHGKQVHSYIVGSNLYLCDLCIKETNVKSYPMPYFIRESHRRIDSAEIKLCLIKHEVERLEEFFTSFIDQFENSSMAKLDDLFQYLNKLILYNYNTAKTVVQQCKKEQQNQIEVKLFELNKIVKEIKHIENKLFIISTKGKDDKYLVKCNEELNEIFTKLNQLVNYETELNLFQMKIGIKENVKERLFEFIQDAYYVDVEHEMISGDNPLIKHILMKDKFWQCVCGEMENLLSENKCINCGIFRKIESYENLISDPFASSKEEIYQLNLRRKQEIHDFQLLYNNKFDKDIKQFYLIDIEWFLNWKCFVTNDQTDKYISNSKKRISCNKAIGILPPGPITNLNLFEKGSKEFNLKTLKIGLKKNDDYLLINEKLWKFFYSNYNCNIEIRIDNQDDIYSSTILFKDAKYYYEIPMKNISTELIKFNDNIFIHDNNKYEKEIKPIEETLINEEILKIDNFGENLYKCEENFTTDPTNSDKTLYYEENLYNLINEEDFNNKKNSKDFKDSEINEKVQFSKNNSKENEIKSTRTSIEKVNIDIKYKEPVIEKKSQLKCSTAKKHSTKQFISNFSFEDEDPLINASNLII